jgi:hypothetical protein
MAVLVALMLETPTPMITVALPDLAMGQSRKGKGIGFAAGYGLWPGDTFTSATAASMISS